MRHVTRALLSFALCLPAVAVAQGFSAFTNVTLIDGRGGPALPDMTVIVRGRTIVSVGASATTAIPPLSFSLTAPEQAPGIVRSMKGGGADNIKAYVGLTEPLVAALVKAAAADSLRVIADLGFANGSDLGIRAGITAYAHAGTWPMADSTIAAMKSRGVSNISTLAVLESFSERRLADLSFLRDSLLSATMLAWFVAELTAHARRPVTPTDTLR